MEPTLIESTGRGNEDYIYTLPNGKKVIISSLDSDFFEKLQLLPAPTKIKMMQLKKGKELEFISWIKRDGSGTVMIGGEWDKESTPKIDDMSHLDEENFNIACLSLTEKTFIASGFNSFVVRLKPVEPPKMPSSI